MTQEIRKLAVDGGDKVRKTPWPGRASLGQEEKAAVDALLDDAIASGSAPGYDGPVEQAFCNEFAEHMGGGYADAVNSGTAAVYCALRALDVEPFTEVIVSPITDPGGCMPVVMANCIPIVADSAPGSFNVGPEQIEARITSLTSAIIVAHIAGEPADMEGITAVARKHNLPVVEDCAQAHGAKINRQLVGSFGEIAAFSTMYSKHFCTGGQGGVVYTRRKDLHQVCRWASDRGKPFGLSAGSTNCIASLNFNADDLRAAVGREQLKKLPMIVSKRRTLVSQIAHGLDRAGIRSVSLPTFPPDTEPSYWFVRAFFHADAVTCDKDTFCTALAAEGLSVVGSYNHMPHKQVWYKNRRAFGSTGFPWTCPLYKGDPDQVFEVPNAECAVEDCFVFFVFESWGEVEVQDILQCFAKVEDAYRR